MIDIIAPVDVRLIKAELTPDKKIGDTNKGGNELYTVTFHDSPNTVREVGRLREIAFREGGACTGKDIDLDEYDTMEKPYHQLIVWDPEEEAIVGGYRYILGPEVEMKENGQPNLYTTFLFNLSETFIRDYLPHTIELGRSFVAPTYQSSKAGAKSIYVLDNLWDGIYSVVMMHPDIHYLYGMMTIHPTLDSASYSLIAHFLDKHFGDRNSLVTALFPPETSIPSALCSLILNEDDLKKDYRLLKTAVRKLGANIPPLVNSYMTLSPTMKIFGGSCDSGDLKGAVEVGLLIDINQVEGDRFSRYYDNYVANLKASIAKRFPRLQAPTDEQVRTHIEKRRMKCLNNIRQTIGKDASSLS